LWGVEKVAESNDVENKEDEVDSEFIEHVEWE
jgi:hypothetical protein